MSNHVHDLELHYQFHLAVNPKIYDLFECRIELLSEFHDLPFQRRLIVVRILTYNYA